MSFRQQVSTLVKKNMIVSIRNRELLIESVIPIIIALMLSLKKQLVALNQLMPLLYCLSISSTQRSVMIHMVDEKSKRYKETQKIMGMSDKAYLAGWALTGYIRIIIAMVVFLTFCSIFNSIFNFDWNSYYDVSQTEMLWPFILFGFAAMHQQFFFTSIFNEVKIAGEIQSFVCVAMTFFIYLIYIDWVAESTTFYIIMSIVSPQCGLAFSYVSSMKADLENQDLFTMNLFPLDVIREAYSATDAGIQLGVLVIVYFVLFLYCEQVIPNEYGIAKHPLFFLGRDKSYQKITDDRSEQQYTTTSNDTSSALYHENLTISAKPSIQVQQLSKQFNKLKAVDNLTLYLYEQQIFCLLGHNGAGKTTMINVLTGMMQKTTGQVQMYGMSLDTDLHKIRKSLGLCTQKDCLYDALTIKEHLLFIAGIKGYVNEDELNDVMEKTDLTLEQDKKVAELSGGSRRKLSLAMALVGDSKIIFLDEPTSGMDAFSRRAIWDILEKIKQDKRTIILTTHHLDEAEILADRIGIMSKGQLIAVGTSDFIKRKFGEGYNLKLTLMDNTQRDEIHGLVDKHAPMSQYDSEQSNESLLSFIIPFSSQSKMGDLFKHLEELGSVTISMQMNTLEDTFIKIGLEDEGQQLMNQSEQERKSMGFNNGTAFDNNEYEIPACLTNPPEFHLGQQIMAIFLRRYYTTIRTNTNYLAIIIPMLTFLLGTSVVASIDFEDIIKGDNLDVAAEFLKVSLISSCSVLAFCFNASVYITLPVMENELYLKQVLRGMGCRIFPYWFGTLMFDFIIYMFLVALFFIVSATLSLDVVFKYWVKGIVCFVCFGFSYILYTYVMGFLFNKLESALKIFTVFCFFADFCLPFMTIGFVDFIYQDNGKPEFVKMIIYVIQVLFAMISPFFAFFEAYTMLSGQFELLTEYYDTPQLITDTYTYCYFMIGQAIVLCGILYFLETKSIFNNNNNILNQQIIPTNNLEQDVVNERDRVLSTDCTDIIKAQLLKKEYLPNQEVLQQTTFGVKQGEIFGIIGPNGAGKSTILNIFTGITNSSAGNALIRDIRPSDRNMDIMQHVGVCPQFDCIWENLTPLEHLTLFGRIKGLTGNNLSTAVKYFINTMQLNLFVDTKAGQLSGGNKRKLCVADALIGGSDITFFDEPSTGVDPISRRFLFSTLKRNVQLRNCSAIMTTHTIEEAEGLSQRIGILILGQFVCLGSPAYLRQKYGTGYQITLKLHNSIDSSDVERMVNEYFPDSKRLEDKRQNFMAFSLSEEQFSFYKTFKFFEGKMESKIIEDFQINQSSLEQIFIHFSKVQQEMNEKAGAIID